jgi:hypothetical protein
MNFSKVDANSQKREIIFEERTDDVDLPWSMHQKDSRSTEYNKKRNAVKKRAP